MAGKTLNAPLMGERSDDPFYAFRDELQGHVHEASERFARWKLLLESTDTSSNRTFKEEDAALTKELGSVQSNISDLEQVLQRVKTHRSNFSHISDEELAKRQAFIKEMKEEVNAMRATMTSTQTQGKIEQDRQQNLTKRSQKDGGSNGFGNASNANFVEDQMQQQQLILREQDEHLDELHNGAVRLGHMAIAIGEEIDQQNHMLDDVQDEMDVTAGRMEMMLGRMDKMLKSNSRCQTNTILALIAILLVLIILVAWT